MDIVLTSSIALELKWRACRAAEQKNYDAANAALGLKMGGKAMAKLKNKHCNVFQRPMAATSDVHLQSLNRIELTFAAPFPGGMAKIMPVFGLEIDFDITPIFNAVINYGRQSYLKVRKTKCMMCWVGHVRGTVAFCDKKLYVTDWTEQDDVCIKIDKTEKVPNAPTMKADKFGQMRQVKGQSRIPTIYQPGVIKGLADNVAKGATDGAKNMMNKIGSMVGSAQATILNRGQNKRRRLLRKSPLPVFDRAMAGMSGFGTNTPGTVGNTDIKSTMANCHNPLKAYGQSGNGALTNEPESRLMETEQKPVLIDAEQFCASMAYQMVNADKPPRYMLKPMKKSGGGGANFAGRLGKVKDKTKGKGTTVGSKDTDTKKTTQDGHEGTAALFIDIDELGDLGKNIPLVHGQMHLGGVPLQR